ncbi:MAG: hypothetical protein V7K89_07690 [Nostoc sp.]|uniref:hypothetical protein n=1 Tax=Nostoc sp. TaxID=1180 RepID=UPI002FFA2BF0
MTARQIRKATNRFVIATGAIAVACSSIALTPVTADAKSITEAITILETIEDDLSQCYGNRRLAM